MEWNENKGKIRFLILVDTVTGSYSIVVIIFYQFNTSGSHF